MFNIDNFLRWRTSVICFLQVSQTGNMV